MPGSTNEIFIETLKEGENILALPEGYDFISLSCLRPAPAGSTYLPGAPVPWAGPGGIALSAPTYSSPITAVQPGKTYQLKVVGESGNWNNLAISEVPSSISR